MKKILIILLFVSLQSFAKKRMILWMHVTDKVYPNFTIKGNKITCEIPNSAFLLYSKEKTILKGNVTRKKTFVVPELKDGVYWVSVTTKTGHVNADLIVSHSQK